MIKMSGLEKSPRHCLTLNRNFSQCERRQNEVGLALFQHHQGFCWFDQSTTPAWIISVNRLSRENHVGVYLTRKIRGAHQVRVVSESRLPVARDFSERFVPATSIEVSEISQAFSQGQQHWVCNTGWIGRIQERANHRQNRGMLLVPLVGLGRRIVPVAQGNCS